MGRSTDCITSSTYAYNTATFIGVTVDFKLTWEPHVDILFTNLETLVYLIRNLAKHVPTQIALNAFYRLFSLYNSVLIWGRSAHASRDFGFQRKCTWVIWGLGYRECCHDHFKPLGDLTVPCIYILQSLIYSKDRFAVHLRHSGLLQLCHM